VQMPNNLHASVSDAVRAAQSFNGPGSFHVDRSIAAQVDAELRAKGIRGFEMLERDAFVIFNRERSPLA